MEKFLTNIFNLLVTTTCILLSGVIRIAKAQMIENSQYYTNLDWDNKDINDIPEKRNMIYNHKVIGTNNIYKVQINSQGFRDYEYSLNKPKNCIRIAAVGDSTTFGAGVDLEYTYVKQLEKLLNNRCDKKIEVLNFGACGASTINELELIEKKVLLYMPDIIMLQMDSNDFQVIHQIREVDPFLNKIIIKLKKSNFRMSRWLKRKLELYKYYKYQRRLTPDDQYNNVIIPLKEIMDICRKKQIKLVVIIYDTANRDVYFNRVLEYITEQNIPLLDLSKTEFGKLTYEEKFSNPKLNRYGVAIDSHPNKYGCQVIAETIVRLFATIPEFQNKCIMVQKQ